MSIGMSREQGFFSAHMYKTIYVCVGIFVVHLLKLRLRLCVLQQSPDGVHICVYQALNYAQILLMHACVLKCISMFVQWTFYGVCLCTKKNSVQMCVWRREGTCACVRSPQPHRGSPHPCQGPVPSHPSLKWQQHTDRPTQTHIQSRTQSSAGAKVNRWAGLNWLAVCSDCKLRWWWLENSSTGCRLLKLSRENNFLLCSGNFFFFFLSFTLLPPPSFPL